MRLDPDNMRKDVNELTNLATKMLAKVETLPTEIPILLERSP